MLRETIMSAALVAACATAAAPAGADDFGASPARTPPGVSLALDELMRETATPLAGLPFRLGPRELGVVDQDADVAFTHACSAEICDRIAGHAAWDVSPKDWTVSIGARTPLVDRLDSLIEGGGRSSWYLFVAADAQAMSWNLRGLGVDDPEDDAHMHLDDMRLIGDAQAGVGARLGGGDLALGFVTREVSHLGAERRESFVGVTFGWEG